MKANSTCEDELVVDSVKVASNWVQLVLGWVDCESHITGNGVLRRVHSEQGQHIRIPLRAEVEEVDDRLLVVSHTPEDLPLHLFAGSVKLANSVQARVVDPNLALLCDSNEVVE